MALPLRSGDPPTQEDCVEIGSINVPRKFSNNQGDPESGKIEMIHMYGEERTDWAVARRAIVQVRGVYDHPVSAKIPGLGTLLYHEKGWEVV